MKITPNDKEELLKFRKFLLRVGELARSVPPLTRPKARVLAYKEVYGDDKEV